MSESPLSTVTPSLDELFSRDPLQLTDTDLDIMIETYRQKRVIWLKNEQEKQDKPKGRKKPSVEPVSAETIAGITSLTDLGL